MGDGTLKPKYLNVLRWKYVLPRLTLLIVVVAGVRFGLDPLLRTIIVSAGQSATGAKVDLATLETSLWKGSVVLGGLQVANPQSPLRNLLEAERTEFSLDVNALLQKRVVVRNGEISGLAFDTERSESGEIEIVVDEHTGPSALDPLIEHASAWASDWLEEAGDRLDSDFADQLQTPQVAEAIEDRWKNRATTLRKRADDLKARGKQLEAEFREVKQNPLRSIEKIPALQAELKTVQYELSSIQNEIKGLPNELKADRNALQTARKADEEFVKQQLKFGKLDGDNLTQVLLGKPVAENTQSALDWIAWVRKRLPTNSSKQIARQRSRGTIVNFGAPAPKFHIERLGLALTAPIGDEPMQFTGSLTNVSDQPRLVAEPARLELVATGGMAVTLEVTSDRRGDVPREELFLVCPAIPVDGRTFGNQEKLAVELAPGMAHVRVELSLTGDELEGHITFAQPAFKVSPLAKPGANETLVAALTESLGNINNLAAEVKLAGTLQKPEIKIESAIGQQLADGISTAVINLAAKKSEALLAKVTGHANEQLAKLDAKKADLEQELMAKLGENQKLFESLASVDGMNGQPFSVPQLGSLGSGLLRR
jgi:uncharacterized protein (TIGR03545 family)